MPVRRILYWRPEGRDLTSGLREFWRRNCRDFSLVMDGSVVDDDVDDDVDDVDDVAVSTIRAVVLKRATMRIVE